MTDGEKKRRAIFDKYATNLKLAAEIGIVDVSYVKKDMYICPLCLEEFSSPEDAETSLTLEDAPPKSLGGKAHVLTCKRCNNDAGRKIDFHLAERLQEIEAHKFLPGSELKGLVNIGGETFRVTIKVDEEGVMTAEHSYKNNHPERLDAAMKLIRKGNKLNLDYLKSRVIPEKLEYALLKTGFMLAFKMFGYSLMLDTCYGQIRDQIRNPEAQIYPSGFWFYAPNGLPSGVFFVTEEGIKCLLAIFEVSTGKVKHTFATVLPLPGYPVVEAIKKIKHRLEHQKPFALKLCPLEQAKANYLDNEENIKAMWKWIKSDKKKEQP